jgi:hypothetical protein
MANIKNINHLKQGTVHPDPIHKAKLDGTHWSGTSQHNEIHPTPDSKTGASNPDGRGWATMDAVTASHTYTSRGGSKRPG